MFASLYWLTAVLHHTLSHKFSTQQMQHEYN